MEGVKVTREECIQLVGLYSKLLKSIPDGWGRSLETSLVPVLELIHLAGHLRLEDSLSDFFLSLIAASHR